MVQGGALGLDLAWACGWAYGLREDAAPEWGVWRLPGHVSRGSAIAALEDELERFLEEQSPLLVAYEAPLPPHLQTDANTAFILIGLSGAVEACCSRYNIPVISRSSTTYRSAVIGRAHLTDEEKRQKPRPTVKTAIVEPWIQSQGWSISDDNGRDAAVVWAYETGHRHPNFGRRRAA